MTRSPLVFVLVLAAVLTGCDGGSGSGDAGIGSSTDATSVGSCDPARQDCPQGQTCDLVCNGTLARIACRAIPAGGGSAVGSTCKGTSECGPASGCFATASTDSSCVRYCDSDTECGQGTTCQTRSVVRNCGQDPRFMVKFCLPAPPGP